MALEARGRKFCKVVHTENGRTWVRRIHCLVIQACDGRLFYLQGSSLPDSISLYCGVPYSGAHLAEVLMSPKDVKATPLLPAASGWFSKRDAIFVVFGIFSYKLTALLAEAAALALV